MAKNNIVMAENAARKKILVLASTFPRWKDDVEPPFVYELSRRLSSNYSVHILAPHAPGTAAEEHFDREKIARDLEKTLMGLASCGGREERRGERF